VIASSTCWRSVEGADAVADRHRVDACLDRGELALEALIDVRELAGEALALVAVSVLELADEVGMLGLEAGDARWSEDAGGEEAVDEVGDAVLADVLPLAVAGLNGEKRDGRVGGAAVGVMLGALARERGECFRRCGWSERRGCR
jgi:hypothetical protein